jgi:hypothetical protein
VKPWRSLGQTHQCYATEAVGARSTHLVPDNTEWECPTCHRRWRKTSNHRLHRGRSLCGCGWVLIEEGKP